jgi:hypothetical protein
MLIMLNLVVVTVTLVFVFALAAAAAAPDPLDLSSDLTPSKMNWSKPYGNSPVKRPAVRTAAPQLNLVSAAGMQ